MADGERARDGSAGQAASLPVTSRMHVLAHIHTFNDADIIDAIVAALQKQTRPLDAILVVDNASSDNTLQQPSLKNVTVVRHSENRGTSGAVHTGISYALEHGYDWIWVFDADSLPEPDALEKLLELYAAFPADLQEETAFLACLHVNVQDSNPQHGGLFTSRGTAPSGPVPEARYYPCHFVIWSGCLYRVAAIRRIGLPNPDYVLDWGEGEYGYRIMKAGYKGFVHQDAVLHHNVRGYTSIRQVEVKLGPARFSIFEFPPIRCYYTCRNVVYFALYEFAEERLHYLRSVSWWLYGFPPRFLVQPWRHRKHILACIRGIWHGFTGQIAARY